MSPKEAIKTKIRIIREKAWFTHFRLLMFHLYPLPPFIVTKNSRKDNINASHTADSHSRYYLCCQRNCCIKMIHSDRRSQRLTSNANQCTQQLQGIKYETKTWAFEHKIFKWLFKSSWLDFTMIVYLKFSF